MNEPSAAAVVDARGMRCPWPALRLSRAMRAESEVLLLADDPQAAREIAALAAQHDWTVETAGEGCWRVAR
ncbi:sulfurtransferase TusA family protein [Sphingopyxis flava]|nr:sulfurtransferase TusA family protein [Sphingopyxis flava]